MPLWNMQLTCYKWLVHHLWLALVIALFTHVTPLNHQSINCQMLLHETLVCLIYELHLPTSHHLEW